MSKDEANEAPKKGGGAKEPPPPRREWTAALQEDLDRIRSVGEECITEAELKTLLLIKGRGSEHATGFRLYDGFEPSGRMHIAQGVFKAMNVNKCTVEGSNGTFCFWVADWFALMNDKMGGDLDKIKVVGEYLQQVWKAAGMNLDHVEFKWASTEITQHADTYWPLMLDVARCFNLTRIQKCCQIMGRLEGNLTAAQVLYPLMQCTDVFFLRADICQLGVDQRKVNMLAREYCDACTPKRKFKPVILSHHMLYGLKAGQEKMSKSDPDSAIFMEDAASDVERKIRNAYCPQAAATSTTTTDNTADSNMEDAGKESMHLVYDDLKNPCLDYVQHIILSPPGATFTAGGVTYTEFAPVKQAFLDGVLTEDDLKTGLIDALNLLLEPVRQHFTTDARAKELLSLVQQYKKESSSSTTSTVPSVERRLDLVALGTVPQGSHMVMAPLPVAQPTWQQVVNVLTCLKTAPSGDTPQPRVLFLSDWTARVTNSVINADVKVISAFYDTFVAACQALDPVVMDQTIVVKQSEAILADPSNYWISVINAGRHFSLKKVMGDDIKDSDGVGHVIGRLLQVADVAAVAPASLAVCATDAVATMVCQDLVLPFLEAKLPQAFATQLPQLVSVNVPMVRLHPERESVALQTPHDEYFLLDEPGQHGKSKMKKAFCEPGNIDFNPVIILAKVLAFDDGKTLTISRSPENGGDRTYACVEELQADYQTEALHPGDLKAAVTPLAVAMMDQLAKALGATKELKQAVKTMKNYQKKAAKS